LKVGTLILRNCSSLETLPEGLDVHFLDISGCINLTEFPPTGSILFGRLDASGCFRLKSLPDWLTHVSQLNVSGCASLEQLPSKLVVSSWVDIAHTRIASLPQEMENMPLRWRGVPSTRGLPLNRKPSARTKSWMSGM